MKKCLLSIFAVVLALGLYAQPANDNCADAEAVNIGTTSFSTIGANTDGPAHPNNCTSTGSTPDSTYADIWYTFTPDFTGIAKWSLCGTADFDTKIVVYTPGSACPPADEDLLACSEDGSSACGVTSEVTFDVTAGETYLLRLGGYGDGSPGESGSGTFTIEEVISTIPNDFCQNAEPIGLVEDYSFSTIGAITDGPDHPNNPCFGFGSITADADIWYSFTPDFSGFVEWSTCNTASLDSRLAVYGPNASCPVTDADLYSCNDDGQGCMGYTSLLNFEVEAGNTYLLRLGGYSGEQGQGTFSLREIVPPVPPANDLCSATESAYVISFEQADLLEVFFEGTTVNGTFDDETFLYPECLTNQNGGEFSDVWYSFNTLGNTELELRLAATTTGSIFYADLYLNCTEQADTILYPGSCVATTADETFVTTTITGLPADSTEMLVHITTRLTSDPPGEFFFQIVGSIFVDAKEINRVERLSVFPNPTNGGLTTSFSLLEAAAVNTTIYNILGEAVNSRQYGLLPAGAQTLTTDVTTLPSGVYLLKLEAGGSARSVKFIKR
ncbi:MAG: T9SS type A sorting domain-containing protein [Lewinellaceae bacterium]|nr:T9SS type A sorting domain-containing protein [Lewinellaceae bacterium]